MIACPDCSAKAYIFGHLRSMFTGKTNWWGYCLTCAESKKGRGPNPFRIREVMRKYPNYPVIQRGAQNACFTWDKDVVGVNEQDVIVQDSIYGLSLTEVVEKLKEEENGSV